MKRLFKIYLDKPELAGVVLLALLVVLFEFTSTGFFLSYENMRGVLGLLPEMALVAMGVTILMIAGEFDISVGSVFALAPMVMAVSMVDGVPFRSGRAPRPRGRRGYRVPQRLHHPALRHSRRSSRRSECCSPRAR